MVVKVAQRIKNAACGVCQPSAEPFLHRQENPRGCSNIPFPTGKRVEILFGILRNLAAIMPATIMTAHITPSLENLLNRPSLVEIYKQSNGDTDYGLWTIYHW